MVDAIMMTKHYRFEVGNELKVPPLFHFRLKRVSINYIVEKTEFMQVGEMIEQCKYDKIICVKIAWNQNRRPGQSI